MHLHRGQFYDPERRGFNYPAQEGSVEIVRNSDIQYLLTTSCFNLTKLETLSLNEAI